MKIYKNLNPHEIPNNTMIVTFIQDNRGFDRVIVDKAQLSQQTADNLLELFIEQDFRRDFIVCEPANSNITIFHKDSHYAQTINEHKFSYSR